MALKKPNIEALFVDLTIEVGKSVTDVDRLWRKYATQNKIV